MRLTSTKRRAYIDFKSLIKTWHKFTTLCWHSGFINGSLHHMSLSAYLEEKGKIYCQGGMEGHRAHMRCSISSKSSDSSTEVVPRSTGWPLIMASMTNRAILSSFLALNWKWSLCHCGHEEDHISLDESIKICMALYSGEEQVRSRCLQILTKVVSCKGLQAGHQKYNRTQNKACIKEPQRPCISLYSKKVTFSSLSHCKKETCHLFKVLAFWNTWIDFFSLAILCYCG